MHYSVRMASAGGRKGSALTNIIMVFICDNGYCQKDDFIMLLCEHEVVSHSVSEDLLFKFIEYHFLSRSGGCIPLQRINPLAVHLQKHRSAHNYRYSIMCTVVRDGELATCTAAEKARATSNIAKAATGPPITTYAYVARCPGKNKMVVVNS